MKENLSFTIEAGGLAGTLKRVGSVIHRASTLPILSTVRLSDEADGVWVEGTDLDRGWREKLPVIGGAEGTGATLCVAHPTLLKLAAGFGGREVLTVMVNAEKKQLTLSGGSRRAALPGLPAEEFPLAQMAQWAAGRDGAVSVPAADLLSGLRSVIHGVSADETRQVLNGVLLEPTKSGTGLTLVATDGRRLAMVDRESVPAGWLQVPGLQVIVPTHLVLSMMGLLEVAGSGTVSVWVSEHGDVLGVASAGGDRWVAGRLIEGRYPNYKQVVPADLPGQGVLTLPREEVLEAVKWLLSLPSTGTGTDGGENVIVEYAVGGDLVLSRSAVDLGDGSVRIAVETPAEKAFKAAFGATYMVQGLSALSSPEVVWRYEDGLSPLRVMADGVTEVWMPRRV